MGTLIVLAVIAVMAAMYMRDQNAPAGKAGGAPTNAIARSRGVACQTQRTQIERDMAMWGASHEDRSPTLRELTASGVRVPSCPEGGSYSVSGGHVLCSLH